MWDFLSFKRLISIEVLIVFYYLGAVILPLLLFWLIVYLRRKFALQDVERFKEAALPAVKQLSANFGLWKWVLLGVVSFLFAELLWRLLFEFLIAFMQMRDALVSAI